MAFCPKSPLVPYIVWASSEGSPFSHGLAPNILLLCYFREETKRDIFLNPHLPSTPVHPYKLDVSIFNFRGIRCTFSFFILFRTDIYIPVSKQRSDAAFSGTLGFYGLEKIFFKTLLWSVTHRFWTKHTWFSYINWRQLDLVWFDVLFYGPSTQFRSFRARSVTLTTLFLGKLLGSWPVLSALLSPVTDNCFLNQRKKKNGRWNMTSVVEIANSIYKFNWVII